MVGSRCDRARRFIVHTLLLAVAGGSWCEPARAQSAAAPALDASDQAIGSPEQRASGNPTARLSQWASPLTGIERERAALLALRLGELIKRESLPLWLSAGYVGVGALGTGLSAFAVSDDPRVGVPWLAGFGIATAVTACTLGSAEDTRRRALQSVGYLPMAGLLFGIAMSGEDARLPQLTTAATAAGYLGTSILSAINAIASNGVGIAVQRRNYARIATPSDRASLTTAQLIRIEADFISRKPALPYWLVMAPIGVSGAVALAPAFDGDRTDRTRALSAALGSLAILNFAVALAVEHPVASYQSDLGKLKLTAIASGTGLALVGSF